MTSDEWQMVEELIDYEGGALRDNEIDFIEDLYNKGEEYDLSERQEDWLSAIHARVIK